jgi:hypothetical protein
MSWRSMRAFIAINQNTDNPDIRYRSHRELALSQTYRPDVDERRVSAVSQVADAPTPL